MNYLLNSQDINSLNPESDNYGISPYNITPESHVKIMRIKEMITNERSFWLVINSPILLVSILGKV